MPQTQTNPFAKFTPDQQAAIRQQLLEAMQSGKLNPEQSKSVSLALTSSDPSIANRPGVQRPPVPSGLGLGDAGSRILDSIGKTAEATSQIPGEFAESSRKYFSESKRANDPWAKASLAFAAPYRAEGDLIKKLASGLWSSTSAGMLSQKQDPADMAANAILMTALGGAGRPPVEGVGDPAMAGPLRGARTRAIESFKRIDGAAKGMPIDVEPAMKWAQKAVELGKRGFSVPKPITDFISWVENSSKSSLTPIPGKPGMIDTAGSFNPVNYEHARDFYTALNEAIPWDQYGGKRGKMFSIAKNMRQDLNNSIIEGLKPEGMDIPYRKALADYHKAMSAYEKAGPFGYVAGKLAGYGTGTVTGHPLIMGYAGAKAGEGIAGSMVRSITESGKPKPLSEWPAEYRNSPRNLSSQGAGGANYTAEDLAALKKRLGLE